MTKIITITDYTVHTLTDGDKLDLEAQAMRNTQRRIDERKAHLAAGIQQELDRPLGVAQGFFWDLFGLLAGMCGVAILMGCISAYAMTL